MHESGIYAAVPGKGPPYRENRPAAYPRRPYNNTRRPWGLFHLPRAPGVALQVMKDPGDRGMVQPAGSDTADPDFQGGQHEEEDHAGRCDEGAQFLPEAQNGPGRREMKALGLPPHQQHKADETHPAQKEVIKEAVQIG